MSKSACKKKVFRSLPSSTETNPRDQVKSISTAKADFSEIRRIGHEPYANNDVPLILRRPFLSTAYSKIDVFKRKITLRVEEEKLAFKSVKPATSIIKRVFVIKSLDSKTNFIGEGDESFDLIYGGYIELNDLDTPLEECWWKVNAHEIAPFTRMENFGRGPYANMKTEWASNNYLDVNRIFRRYYEASNVGCIQENHRHKGDPIPEPSNCKVRRFEMMKYSFDDDEEYITIKESEYLNHSKDSLDAYRELVHLINEGWVMTMPE
ncbi:hypothetical protein Tco_0290933 [Tanacetum coccineum]